MKYRQWHLFIPLSMVGGAWNVMIYKNPYAGTGDYICLIGWVVIAAEIGWHINACLVLQHAGRDVESLDRGTPTATSNYRPLPNLNTLESVVTTPSRVVELNEGDLTPKASTQLRSAAPDAGKKLDRRIVTWAHGVTYLNAPMTQAWWCVGPNKAFSKPAYVAWIGDLLKDKIVVPENPNNPRSKPVANGRAGKAYIKGLADERVYRPFPTYESSETSTAFLREQMRKRATEGQGGAE